MADHIPGSSLPAFKHTVVEVDLEKTRERELSGNEDPASHYTSRWEVPGILSY